VYQLVDGVEIVSQLEARRRYPDCVMLFANTMEGKDQSDTYGFVCMTASDEDGMDKFYGDHGIDYVKRFSFAVSASVLAGKDYEVPKGISDVENKMVRLNLF
jgi:hypothetical protein